jgi:hypothetical protein
MKTLPASIIALVAVVILVGLGWAVLQGNVHDEYRLPVIAVFAIAAMFAVIAFVAAVYQSAQLSSTQALGLPEGSVRALIALSLIVVFTVITLFMLARLTTSQQVCTDLAAAIKSAAGAGDASIKEAIAVVSTRQQAAQDLAKQLLTMLGTLLAAISSFYFGSSAAASANDPKKVGDAVGSAMAQIGVSGQPQGQAAPATPTPATPAPAAAAQGVEPEAQPPANVV